MTKCYTRIVVNYGRCPECTTHLTEDWPHPDVMRVVCTWCNWPVPEEYCDEEEIANRRTRTPEPD